MTAVQYSLLVSIIFALVAILQIVRAVTGLPVTVGQTSIPVWASWIACAVAVVLAWLGYSASRSQAPGLDPDRGCGEPARCTGGDNHILIGGHHRLAVAARLVNDSSGEIPANL
ncbi:MULTISPECIES: hypothetical protein [Bradyrhizobium]|uniref:hypothetical protein n=1 Tax=Bradyrhizobium elkanii TaxID=29448 RepID=UPI0012BCA559|nr:hypothetical protein [Bradyrhizobium elkanii]